MTYRVTKVWGFCFIFTPLILISFVAISSTSISDIHKSAVLFFSLFILLFASCWSLKMETPRTRFLFGLFFFTTIFFFRDAANYYYANEANSIIIFLARFLMVSLLLMVCAGSKNFYDAYVLKQLILVGLTLGILKNLQMTDISGNTITILILVGTIYSRAKLAKLFGLMLIVFFSIAFSAVSGLIASLIYTFYILIGRNAMGKNWFSLLLASSSLLLFIVQLPLAYHFGEDILLNEIFNKRFFIWASYLELVWDDPTQLVIGHGVIDSTTSAQIGNLVEEEFGVGRQYSAHSLYINTAYEYGIIFLFFVATSVLLSLMKPDVDENTLLILSILFFLGLVVPINIGGFSPVDIIFTYLLLRILSISSTKKRCLAGEHDLASHNP